MTNRYTIAASFEPGRVNDLPLFVLSELLQSKTDEKGRASFFAEDALNDFTDRMLGDRQSLDGLRDLLAAGACHNPALAKAFDLEGLAFSPTLAGTAMRREIPVSDMDEWKAQYVQSGIGIEHDPEKLMIAALTDLSNSVLQRAFAVSIENPDGTSRGLIFSGGQVIEHPNGKEAIDLIADINRERTENRALVVSYLHHSGAHGDVLTSSQQMEVYALADGFGFLDPETLSQINDGYDWSHVRDSTDEGWKRMADWLRQNGYGPDGPTSAPKR